MNHHVIAAADLATMNLGAELRDASPEVRAAAVERSRRLPEPNTMRAAWLRLPVSMRDRIGTAALTHSFYSWAYQEDPAALTVEAGKRCEDVAFLALNTVEAIAMSALPELYGTDTKPPLWEREDANAAACPLSADASPLKVAIAEHLRAEVSLYAEMGRENDDPVRVALAEAEELAHQAAVEAPLRDRADLVAFYEHFSHDAEEGSVLAKALDALALALQVGTEAEGAFQSAAVAPEDRLSHRTAAVELHALAFPEEMVCLSPLQLAIKAHRQALAELESAGPFDGDSPELVALDSAELAAMEALLAAPYVKPSDALALVSHLRPLVGERLHPTLKDMGEVTCGVLAKVIDVCTAAMRRDDGLAPTCRG